MKAIAIMTILTLVAGCGGMMRKADPVTAYEYGDSSKSCDALKSDLDQCTSEIDRIKARQNTKIGMNVAVGVASAILFWPALFVMDFSDVDAKEIEAQQQRYQSITLICKEKDCGFEIAELEIKSPSKKEVSR